MREREREIKKDESEREREREFHGRIFLNLSIASFYNS